MDLDKFIIDDLDNPPDIFTEEDFSTIRDPDVLERAKKEARRRSYMRNRQKWANSQKINKMNDTKNKEKP